MFDHANQFTLRLTAFEILNEKIRHLVVKPNSKTNMRFSKKIKSNEHFGKMINQILETRTENSHLVVKLALWSDESIISTLNLVDIGVILSPGRSGTKAQELSYRFNRTGIMVLTQSLVSLAK